MEDLNEKETGNESEATVETDRKAQENPSINGYLDHQRQTLELLDQSILNAQEMSQAKTGRGHNSDSRLEWIKTLAKLMELRSSTLETIKHTLLGRDYESCQYNEPADTDGGCWQFERDFHKYVTAPWTLDDLKLKCEDCNIESEDVSERRFPEERDEHYTIIKNEERIELCPECYEKRSQRRDQEENDDDQDGTETDSEPTIRDAKCEELKERIKAMQAAGKVSSATAELMIRALNNIQNETQKGRAPAS